MPKLTLDAGSAVVNGVLYAVGGKVCCAEKHVSTVYAYTPGTGWQAVASLPLAYTNPAPGEDAGVEDVAATSGGDGKLYVFGGSTGAFTGQRDSAAVYDPGTDQWTLLDPMPTARSAATANLIGGKIYVAGGLDSSGASISSVDVFDVSSLSWDSPTTSMNAARSHHASTVIAGKLYVFGGRTRLADGTESPGILKTGEVFDPAGPTWSAIKPMNFGRRSPDAGTLNGCAVVVGGEGKGGFPGTFYETELYNPVSNTWTVLAGMPTARHGAAAGVIGGDLYVAGGGPSKGSSFTDVNEKLTVPASAC
jgi:N-acetylneuraminic acid mutarotase